MCLGFDCCYGDGARTERRLRTVEHVWVLTVAMVMLPGQKADPGLWSVSGF